MKPLSISLTLVPLIAIACVLAMAVACHAAAAEEVPSPTTSSAADQRGLPYCGGAVRLDRVDWVDRYKKTIADIAAVGSDTVAFRLDLRMENGRSNVVWADVRRTPSSAQLGELIDYAKGIHLRVVLLPTVVLEDPGGTDWRGTIRPESWDTWFDSYRGVLLHFAWIAEAHKVELFSIGTELVSSEERAEQWLRTISEVRQVYHGKLTYSANWDHFAAIRFWDQLDVVGMNSFWRIGHDAGVTVSDIKGNWEGIHDELAGFCRTMHGKPIIFLEAGWCSMPSAAYEPWDYTRMAELPVDLDLQKRLYQGFFETWYGDPRLAGIIIHEWSPDEGGPEDKGYTPKGKPAEAVVREWFGKPRWSVKQ